MGICYLSTASSLPFRLKHFLVVPSSPFSRATSRWISAFEFHQGNQRVKKIRVGTKLVVPVFA